MHAIQYERTVTILRPMDVHIVQVTEPEAVTDPSDAVYAERTRELITDIRDMVERIAEELCLKLQVYEYGLHANIGVPSRNATGWIRHSNVIASIDPTDEQLAYIMTCMRMNPVMSMLISCGNKDFIEQRFKHLSTQETLVFGRKTTRQSRAFLLPSISSDPEALEETAKSALLYPYEAA